MVIAYGSCVGSWERAARYVLPRVEGRPFIGLSGQTSIAFGYNAILDAYMNTGHDGPVVLLHDDLEVVDPDAEAKILTAMADPGVALVGVCGGTSDATLAWWNGPTVGRQRINGRTLDFGPRTGSVAILEGSFLAFSPWAVQWLRFDTRFPGFHSYDEVCLTARAAGGRVIVTDIDTWHHVDLGFKSEASARAWARGEAQFQQKWHTGGHA